MTEAEWLTCADPTPMLDFLRGKVSDRKLRLFAVACCRQIQNLLSNRYSRKALAVAERYADGEVSVEKLGFAWGDARRAAQVAYRKGKQESEDASAMWAVSRACEADIGMVLTAVAVCLGARMKAFSIDRSRFTDFQSEQSSLLRDIFGNPFRSVAFNPAWRPPIVLALAQAIYDERAFDRLPTLADALERAGCDNAEILAHCRQPGHVRGCWALDAVLEKA